MNIRSYIIRFFVLPIVVRDRNVDRALKMLKRQNQRNGFNKAVKRTQAYTKPSVLRKRKAAEAHKRMQRNLQRRRQRDGF